MPRYDDRYGTTRLYVGHLSSRTRSRDLEHIFSRYGRAMYDALPVLKSNDGLTVSDNRFRRVRDVDMKHDFAFVEFSDPRDADDARYSLNGREFDGNRLVVEFAKENVPRGPGGSQEYLGRGPLPGSGRCFNCGLDGHWARDCKAGDWKNKCYRCGERGHIEKNCHNSPKKLSRRGRSYSRSPIRSGSPRRGRSRSRSFSRSRSYSLSRSPPPKRERIIEREKSRSPRYSRSPEPRISPPSSKSRKRSPTPEEGSGSPVKASSSPNRAKLAAKGDGPNNSESPRARSRSPERDSPFPSEANGRSPSPRDDRSPINDEDDNNNLSPRDSQSP